MVALMIGKDIIRILIISTFLRNFRVTDFIQNQFQERIQDMHRDGHFQQHLVGIPYLKFQLMVHSEKHMDLNSSSQKKVLFMKADFQAGFLMHWHMLTGMKME